MYKNCFVPSKETNRNMEQLAREILGGKSLTSSEPPSAEALNLAYFLLANNGGQMPNLDQDGNNSVLFLNLEETLGSKSAAYKAKAYIYTLDFAERYGEWVGQFDEHGRAMPEPMWKEEFASDWANDLFDISKSTRDDLDAYLFKNTYSTILDDAAITKIHLYDANPNAIDRTISEDRLKTVEKWLTEGKSEYPEKDQELKNIVDVIRSKYTDSQAEKRDRHIETAKYLFYKTVYNDKLLEKLLSSARNDMISVWGLDVDKDSGQAVNTVDKNIDPKLYDVVQIRCNIVNSLLSGSDNFLLSSTNNRLIVHNVVLNYLSGMSAPSMASSMFSSYMDMYKNTLLVLNVLVDLKYLSKDAIKDPENHRVEISKAYNKFKGDLQEEADLYISGKKKMDSKIKQWFKDAQNIVDFVLFHIAVGVSNKAINALAYAGAIALGLTAGHVLGTPMIFTAAGFMGLHLFIQEFSKAHVKTNYTNGLQEGLAPVSLKDWKTYRKGRTDAMQKLMFAVSLGKDLVLTYSGVQYSTTNFVSDILTVQKAGAMLLVLGKMAENLQSQLKALREDEDHSVIHSLMYLLEDAIQHHKTNNYYPQQFFQQYLSRAESQIMEAIAELKNMRDNIEDLDPARLFKIKTDIIGAYDVTTNYISTYMNYFPLKEFNKGGDLFNLVNELTVMRIAEAKKEFKETLDLYAKFYSEEVLNETAGRTISSEKLTTIKQNVEHWFKNEVNNYGQLSVVERLITPARSSSSPVVRLLKQKLEEVNDWAEKEANAVGSELENLRTICRSFSDRISFNNQCIRYMERSSDGQFTGNFESDVNTGEYEYLAQAERDFLDNKYGVLRGPSNAPIWNSEDQWLKWNIDYVIWMAGGERTEEGEYKRPVNENNVRIHRRYKMQYYIDKCTILGREGVELLSDINSKISGIEKTCLDEVEYTTSKGEKVKRTFPNIAKLPDEARIRLLELKNRKRMLSSLYEIYWNEDHTKIKSIEFKQGISIEARWKRFLEWEQKKSTYYDQRPEIDYEFFHAVQGKYTGADLELFNKLYTQMEYNPIISDKFKINGRVTYVLKDKNGQDIPQCRSLVSLIRLRNTLRTLINSNNEKRTPDLSKIGEDISSEETANLWKQIADVDRQIEKLKKEIEVTNKNAKPNEKIIKYSRIDPSVNVGKFSREKYTTREYVPRIDEQTGKDKPNDRFWEYLLQKNPYLLKKDIANADGKYVVPFLSRETLNITAYTEFDNIEHGQFYKPVPQSSFIHGESSMLDDKFDNSSTDYIQVNKTFVDSNGKLPFDNTENYNKIKDDKFYQKLIEITDKAWKNYKGLTRAYRYMLPQREISLSGQIGRTFTQSKTLKSGIKNAASRAFHDTYNFNTRDLDEEYLDDVIVRPDGSIVETVSSRWTKRLKNRNAIDSDLVSSVVDFYHESLKYAIRKKYAPIMELMHFLLSGGYGATGGTSSRYQAEVLRHEMSKVLYGRTYTGSGQNGRITPDEIAAAKLTRTFRGLLHTRLMSHNWLSVLKNAWDSICNLCQAAMTAKYVLTRNILRSLGFLFYDWKANGLARFAPISLVSGINRSFATNLTQALMLLNGIQENVHSRFSGQNKWAIRRLLEKTESIEFEGIDYTSKAIITNAVYDAYRLMYNPNTGKYEFLNEEEAEFAYMSHGSTNGRQDGYDAWVKAEKEDLTLRDMYVQDENGVAVLKEYVYVTGPSLDVNTGKKVDKVNKLKVEDIIRPYSKISQFEDKRSRVLETKIRTTIKQMCQVANGMLDEMDKSQVATHYAGSLLFAFRGWMVSQASEFYKKGYDFLDYSKDTDSQTWLEKVKDLFNMPMRRKGELYDPDYEGMYNFATGTIDMGLHRNLLQNLITHFGSFIKMALIIPNYLPRNSILSSSKQRLLGNQQKMSQAAFYSLRNFAAAFDMLVLTLAATVGTLALYEGGGDDDDEDGYVSKKAMRSLLYTAMLASISERFPQLGAGAFVINISDIVNSLTVGVTLIDDVDYVISFASQLIQLLEGTINDQYITEDEEIFGHLVNGSFKGKSKLQRAATRTFAVLGIDTAPILGSIDLYNYLTQDSPDWLQLPDVIRDQNMIDYNLNIYKNITESGNVGRAKWYQSIVPTKWFSSWLEDTPIRITPKPKPKPNATRSVAITSDRGV